MPGGEEDKPGQAPKKEPVAPVDERKSVFAVAHIVSSLHPESFPETKRLLDPAFMSATRQQKLLVLGEVLEPLQGRRPEEERKKREGHLEEAIAAVEELIRVVAEPDQAVVEARKLIANGEWEEARRRIGEVACFAVRTPPASLVYLNGICAYARLESQPALDSMKLLYEGAADERLRARAGFMVARIHAESDEPELALKTAEEVADEYPDSADAKRARALIEKLSAPGKEKPREKAVSGGKER